MLYIVASMIVGSMIVGGVVTMYSIYGSSEGFSLVLNHQSISAVCVLARDYIGCGFRFMLQEVIQHCCTPFP